jgi:hypothetical protein
MIYIYIRYYIDRYYTIIIIIVTIIKTTLIYIPKNRRYHWHTQWPEMVMKRQLAAQGTALASRAISIWPVEIAGTHEKWNGHVWQYCLQPPRSLHPNFPETWCLKGRAPKGMSNISQLFFNEGSPYLWCLSSRPHSPCRSPCATLDLVKNPAHKNSKNIHVPYRSL